MNIQDCKQSAVDEFEYAMSSAREKNGLEDRTVKVLARSINSPVVHQVMRSLESKSLGNLSLRVVLTGNRGKKDARALQERLKTAFASDNCTGEIKQLCHRSPEQTEEQIQIGSEHLWVGKPGARLEEFEYFANDNVAVSENKYADELFEFNWHMSDAI